MTKKLKAILFSLFLIFSLVGCNKTEPISMNPINIDFNVKTVDNGTITFNYPIDEWEEAPSFNPDLIKILLYPKNDLEKTTNITVGITAESTNLTLDDYVKLLPSQLEKSSPGTKVTVAELRKINDIEVSYIELNTKITEEAMEYGLQNGIFSQENIEALGGKEAFLNQPEKKQIQMSVSFNDRITNITGTYEDDKNRETVLKAMTTMVQTSTLK